MPNGDAPSEAAVEGQLRQAHQALSDAKGARDAELSDTVVVNRLYLGNSETAPRLDFGVESRKLPCQRWFVRSIYR